MGYYKDALISRVICTSKTCQTFPPDAGSDFSVWETRRTLPGGKREPASFTELEGSVHGKRRVGLGDWERGRGVRPPPTPLSSSGPKNPPSSLHLSCGWDSTIFLGRPGEAKETRMNFGQFPSPLGHSAAAAACQCLCVWERKGGVARREKSCFCQQLLRLFLGNKTCIVLV